MQSKSLLLSAVQWKSHASLLFWDQYAYDSRVRIINQLTTPFRVLFCKMLDVGGMTVGRLWLWLAHAC